MVSNFSLLRLYNLQLKTLQLTLRKKPIVDKDLSKMRHVDSTTYLLVP